MNDLIFIGGVHGVGKTTFCNELVNTYQIPTYSASRIISELKKQNLPSNKLIPDIDVNQAFLLEGLKKIKSMRKVFILDGHFCLINENRTISKIPETVFYQIKPSACIVVMDTVSSIIERLEIRDNIDYESSFIEHFQDEEINHAVFLANTLNIPYHIYNQSTQSMSQLHNFITELGVIK
ncbi:ATP-binding protein [Paenibacillus sediminis]|uniref:Adenylate kinase n=1 Tax=Paenibacillus sediminis TaxID=664909 RepID=A0ABS4H2Y1_9BACL|nr:ATP-binding protein [Paenibacillus sediminis]MBP1936874.1 adenylate kinase [Paenibacillus sediminis]